jgi:RNA polymerase sigma factor (sigma-70 family)
MREFDDALPDLFRVSYRVAFRMTGSHHEAEDIAQEIGARALVRWEKLEPYAEAWVARSTANLVLDRVRRSRLLGALPGWSQKRTADAGLASERLDLVEALRHLPRRQREVVVLRYLSDLGEQEVAEKLGCSVGTVKQHARRGLLALRLQLRAEESG